MNKFIKQISERFELLHPFNYKVGSSPIGDDWARLLSYSCCSFEGEIDHILDLKAEMVWEFIECCHTECDVENMMFLLNK